MLAVVQHDFKKPVVPRGQIVTRLPGGAIAVSDLLEVALWELFGDEPVYFVRRGRVYVVSILGFVSVKNGVALVVKALAYKPTEDACRISRIGDSGIGTFPVKGGDVVFGDRAPMTDARVLVGPALNARKQAFGAWPVTLH